MGKDKQPQYVIRVNQEQLQLISEACDVASRIYRGIPDTIHLFQNVLSQRTETLGQGRTPDLLERREKLDILLRELGKVLNPERRTDLTPQEHTLMDIHQVLRHQLWKEQPDPPQYVNAATVTRWGPHPLCRVEQEKNK